jgi:hypothetical protein
MGKRQMPSGGFFIAMEKTMFTSDAVSSNEALHDR